MKHGRVAIPAVPVAWLLPEAFVDNGVLHPASAPVKAKAAHMSTAVNVVRIVAAEITSGPFLVVW